MKQNRLMITPPDGIEVRGVIQFVHGMCEHKERYDETMKYFSKNGYVCIISDLPGHGENVAFPNDYGYFGKDGVNNLIKCVHNNTLFIKEHFPDIPYTLFGHSMGSLICRTYLKRYDNFVDTAFICGSPSDNSLKAAAIPFLNTLTAIWGEHKKSNFAKNLCTGAFEKPFKSEGIPNSWICSDMDIVKKYNNDELCGFTFTLNGYSTLVKLLFAVYSDKGWKVSDPDLPIYFISGENDPCMVDKKHFKDAVNTMKKAGYKNVHARLFNEMRHEILNEKGKESVYRYILDNLPG